VFTNVAGIIECASPGTNDAVSEATA
jgi:hypothetical protein